MNSAEPAFEVSAIGRRFALGRWSEDRDDVTIPFHNLFLALQANAEAKAQVAGLMAELNRECRLADRL